MFTTPQLFVVVMAVKPAATHPQAQEVRWAALQLWLLTESADSALARVRALIGSADFGSKWELATRNCAVKLASLWRGPIPTQARALTQTTEIVIEEQTTSKDSDFPNFERLFGDDPLTLRTL